MGKKWVDVDIYGTVTERSKEINIHYSRIWLRCGLYKIDRAVFLT